MLIIANLYQLLIMSAFFNYLRTLRALFIPSKICPGLTVFNNISSVIRVCSFYINYYVSFYFLLVSSNVVRKGGKVNGARSSAKRSKFYCRITYQLARDNREFVAVIGRFVQPLKHLSLSFLPAVGFARQSS